MASPSTTVSLPGDTVGRDVTIATAGHVDHGKSTLIRALTGTDPDRLPEERRREMTIELGFASIIRPGGGRLAFIDVPGHERLVETMVSGSGTVDATLLVVAADDGPMPQTVEHLRILRLLGVEQFVVAITRTDLVDGDWLDLSIAATRDLLIEHGVGHASIVPVSAIIGAGLDHLRDRLLAVTPRHTVTGNVEAVWLPIDRVFHRRGSGTIVAGTLLRGQLQRGDTARIWPVDLRCTVRQIQSHNQSIEFALAGQRVAVNLTGIGIGIDQVSRGNVLSDQPIPATGTVEIRLELVGPVPNSGELVRVMIGTDRVDATVQLIERLDALDSDQWLARLRFRRPVATFPGDRLIVRRPSPAATIGGGVILACHAVRPPRLGAGRRAELAALAADAPNRRSGVA